MDNGNSSTSRRQSRTWSLAALGAALAVTLTLATISLDNVFAHGESAMGYFLMWPTFIMLWPARHIFELFGWQWSRISSDVWQTTAAFPVCMVFLINALLLALVGAAIGFMLRNWRRGR